MKDYNEYLYLKSIYNSDTMFKSMHEYNHKSFKIIQDDINKEKYLPIIKDQLISNPTWFDIIVIPYIIKVNMSDDDIIKTQGRFKDLVKYHISYLTKKIRELKIEKINNN